MDDDRPDRRPGRPPRALSRSSLWSDEERGDGPTGGPQPLRARWDPVPPPRPRVGHRRARAERRRSSVGWFIHHYGWRAYALPVLAALTVVTVIGIASAPDSADAAQSGDSSGGGEVTVTVGSSVPTTVTVAGPRVTTTVAGPDGAGASGDGSTVGALSGAHPGSAVPTPPAIDSGQAFRGVVMGLLPPGGAFAHTGAGTFHVVPGTSKALGDGPEHRTFTIEVEDGIESTAADQEFAQAVMEVLSSPRSWIGGDEFTLQRVDSGTPDFRITLTSQQTTRQSGLCGWDVKLEASCYNHVPNRVIINDARWVRGSYAYGDDVASYRVYAVNHEVGHALGFHHEPCPSNGALAPVMMQQSWSTSDDDIAKLNPGGRVPADGKVCRANPFPYPDHAG